MTHSKALLSAELAVKPLKMAEVLRTHWQGEVVLTLLEALVSEDLKISPEEASSLSLALAVRLWIACSWSNTSRAVAAQS